MKLIITSSIKKLEFEPVQNIFTLDCIKVAAKKSIEGLGESIKSCIKIPSTTLQKIYLTSSGGAGRAVFLLKIDEEKSVLVMIKMKKDKKIGLNMSIKNPNFEKTLDKNLNLILEDLAQGNQEEFNL